MIIEDIIKTGDNHNIYLHNEGLFWRSYEYSAYAFIKNIKQYNAKKKFIKKVNRDIVFIGFPNSTLDNIPDLCNKNSFAINKSNNLIKIELPSKKEGFSKWKNEIAIADGNKVKKDDITIIERITSFPLVTKTPVEAQQFLYKLQMEINSNL